MRRYAGTSRRNVVTHVPAGRRSDGALRGGVSTKDADSTRADEQSEHDENNAPKYVLLDNSPDSGDNENHGRNQQDGVQHNGS